MIASEVSDRALQAQREALDRIGPAVSIEALCARLRAHGHEVCVAQEIRATALVMRLAEIGVDLREARTAAGWLVAVLATNRTEAEAVRKLIFEWWQERGSPAPAVGVSPPVAPLEHLERRTRRRRDLRQWLVAISVLLGIGAFAWLFIDGLPSEGIAGGEALVPQIEGLSYPTDDPVRTVAAFAAGWLFPRLCLFAPFLVFAWYCVRPRASADAVIRREQGEGTWLLDVQVPVAQSELFTSPASLAAAKALKAPSYRPGTRLDVGPSIAATVRAGGLPRIEYAPTRRSHEYVVLCEASGDGDHHYLLADALLARLQAHDVPVVRFDAHGHLKHVRHAAGQRSGAPIETLAEVAARYLGARLIVVGTGAALFEGTGLAFAEAPGFTSSLRGAQLFATFASPVLLSTTPVERWAGPEHRLELGGVRVFPATSAGLALAAAYFDERAREPEASVLTRLPADEDPLLADLRSQRQRWLSDLAPEARECEALAHRLRGYMGSGPGFELLAMIAAFPIVRPDLTALLAEVVLAEPIDEVLLGRLSRLPWLQVGRMPDWLRLALLRSLTETERERLSELANRATTRLFAQLDSPQSPASESLSSVPGIDLMARPDLRARVAARLGLGAGLLDGEGIFLRFLAGAPPEELDRPAPGAAAVRVRGGRLALGAGTLLLGLVALALAQGFVTWLGTWLLSAVVNLGDMFTLAMMLFLLVLPALLARNELRPTSQVTDGLPWYLGGARRLRALDALARQAEDRYRASLQANWRQRSVPREDGRAGAGAGDGAKVAP